MRKRTVALGACVAVLLAGGGWYASLDQETRGLLRPSRWRSRKASRS